MMKSTNDRHNTRENDERLDSASSDWEHRRRTSLCSDETRVGSAALTFERDILRAVFCRLQIASKPNGGVPAATQLVYDCVVLE